MSTHASSVQSLPAEDLRRDAGFQAFWLLRAGFAVLPILFGIDKFANVLTGDWTKYLAPAFNHIVGNASTTMHVVGIVEIVAGVIVLLLPRIGGPVVALWLLGIIVNLLIIRGYGDVALRDFGLMAAALTLSRLAYAYPNDIRLLRSDSAR